MSIQSFIQDSEKEFNYKFNSHGGADDLGVYLGEASYKMIESFTSSKLHQLIEEVRKEVAEKIDKDDYIGKKWHKESQIEVDGWNAALDSVLNLLDGINNEPKK